MSSAVIGRWSILAYLPGHRLIAGSMLGWAGWAGLSIAAQEEVTTFGGATVSLPPFYVEPARAVVWQHVRGPGFELITTNDREFARRFARGYYEQVRLVRLLVPDRYLWKPFWPDVFVVVAPDNFRREKDEALKNVLNRNRAAQKARGHSEKFLPNLRLLGPDSSVVFAFLGPNRLGDEEEGFLPGTRARIDLPGQRRRPGFHFSANRLLQQLSHRAPALPHWVIAGLTGIYQDAGFSANEIRLPPLTLEFPLAFIPPASPPPDTDEQGEEEPADSAIDPPEPEILVSLPRVFSAMPAAHAIGSSEWLEWSKLFVHWSLLADDREHVDGFWNFVDRMELESPTERVFQECFGLTMDQCHQRLVDYAALATARPRNLKPPRGALPRFKVARADRAAVALLMAEWERLETDYVRDKHPALVEEYLQRARQTIAVARQNGHDGPRLEAVSGLLEYAADNAAVARAQLESAFAAGVHRPHLLQVLAQLRHRQTRATVAADARLEEEAILPTLELLQQAHRTEPAIPAVYSQLVDVWESANVLPSQKDISVLAAGVRRFPQHYPVVTRMALMQARHGHIRSALQILDYASSRSRTEVVASYEEIRQRLEAKQDQDVTTAP